MPPQNVVSSRIDVDGAHRRVRGELLEVDDDRVGREREPHEVAQRLHLRDAEHRVLEPVVVEVLDRPAEAHGVAERQRAVGVEAQAFARAALRRARDSTRARASGGNTPPFSLCVRKPCRALQRLRVRDELLGRAHFALAGRRVREAEEQVARELDVVAQLAAEERVHRDAELLADDVEARELERRVQLRAVVVEARRRVADLEAHRLEREHVVAGEVGLERRRTRASRPRRRRPSRRGRRSRRRSRPRRSCARTGPSARRCCAAAALRAAR